MHLCLNRHPIPISLELPSMATDSPTVEMTGEDAETRSLDNPSSENESDIGESPQDLEGWYNSFPKKIH